MSMSSTIWLKRAGPNSFEPWMGMVTRLPSGRQYMAWLPFWRAKIKPSRKATRMASFGFGRRGIEGSLYGNFYRGEAYRFSYRNKFGLTFAVFHVELNYFADIAKRFFKGFPLRITALHGGNISKIITVCVFFNNRRKLVYFKGFFHNASIAYLKVKSQKFKRLLAHIRFSLA